MATESKPGQDEGRYASQGRGDHRAVRPLTERADARREQQKAGNRGNGSRKNA